MIDKWTFGTWYELACVNSSINKIYLKLYDQKIMLNKEQSQKMHCIKGMVISSLLVK